MLEQLIAGVDEAGRGPLAGPVIAAAVILNPQKKIVGIKDSKLLSEKKREQLYYEIISSCLSYAIGRADVAEIDELNILQATLLAMRRAVLNLSINPMMVLVDGNQLPKIPHKAEAIIQGDKKIKEISAASILAKVTRDREMIELDRQHPGFHFKDNKGYGTKKHLVALQEKGPSRVHRKSFAPVKELLSHARTL